MTKTELKAQQDALQQYRRFLPTLQLKKQQLQVEVRLSRERLRENAEKQRQLIERMSEWIAVFSDREMLEKVMSGLRLVRVEKGSMNIAGVMIPTFERAEFEMPALSPVDTAWYTDEAVESLKQAASLRMDGRIIEEQERLLNKELRTASQRVNLFEKVKIPECLENIRKIQIQLGDQSTAAVARSKIAKRKSGGVSI